MTSSLQKGTSSPQNLAPSQQNMMSSQQNMAPLCQSNGTLIQPRINNIDKTSLSPGHEAEISVVDDYVEVTSQPLEIVTSSNDVMMTSPEDMIMSHIMGNPLDETEDINMVNVN